MPVAFQFPAGVQKPPIGCRLNDEHPFMRGHLLSVLFHGQGLCHDAGSVDTGPVIYANPKLSPSNGISLPYRSHLSGGSDAPYASNLEGVCLRVGVGNQLTLCLSSVFPTTGVTLCFVRRKTDTTNRAAALFGASTAGGTSSIYCLAPWSDGTVYWDFGGEAGANRLSVAGLSFSTFTPERWVFTAGPRGSSIWQNGVKVANQSTALTRTANNDAVMLNGSTSPFHGTDAQDLNFFMAIDQQWPDDLCRWWSASPYEHLESPDDPQLYWFVAGGASGPIPPSNEFTIAGTARDILQNWSISEQLNERGTMRFGIKSMDASYRPGLREVVDFNWVGIHFFAGHIHHTDESGLGGYGVVPIVTQCGATDFGALPDRRQVSGMTLAAGTLKSQMTTLAAHLAIYGVTVDPAQVNGPAMPEMILASGKLTQGFQNLSVSSGYAFEIDYDLVARMFDPGTEAAPFDIEDGDGRVIGDVKVSPTTVEYGNHITVRFTTPAVAAWAFFTLTDIPSEDETVTIGGTTYIWKNAPGGAPEVQIGASVAASIDNLIGAVFPSHPEVVAFEQASDVMRITAITAGASGNGIQVATTCVDGEWTTEGGGEVSHLNLGSDAALTGVAIAEDVPAQDGGLNLFEKEYQHPEVENQEAADALAEGYLVRSLVQPREIRYRTRLHGLHPGQQQQIQVTGRNVDGPCLITAVDITPEGSALYNYDVTAVEGLVIVPSHQDGWRHMQGASVSGN